MLNAIVADPWERLVPRGMIRSELAAAADRFRADKQPRPLAEKQELQAGAD